MWNGRCRETAAALSRDAWTLMRPHRRRRGDTASRRRRRADHVKFKFIVHAESLTFSTTHVSGHSAVVKSLLWEMITTPPSNSLMASANAPNDSLSR